MKIQESVPLADLTSWQIGGPAEFFSQPCNEVELEECLLWGHANKKEITILGGGSNVLIADQGVKGLVISMRKFSKTAIHESATEISIECLAGTSKSELLKVFLKYQLEPALFLAGLPGDIGGGIVMNAGVAEKLKPQEFGEIVKSFDVWKVQGAKIVKKKYSHAEIKWSYRHSEGWQPGIIVSALICVPRQSNPKIIESVREANRNRLLKQPLDMPSCGSVFKNPEGYKVAQLIESSGLKGTRIGDAQVSLKHANFIVNLGHATAEDTWNLMNRVQQTVFEKTGISIKTEVIKMGF